MDDDHGARSTRLHAGTLILVKTSQGSIWPAEILGKNDGHTPTEWFDSVTPGKTLVGFFGTGQHGVVSSKSISTYEETAVSQSNDDRVKLAFEQANLGSGFWNIFSPSDAKKTFQRNLWERTRKKIFDVKQRKEWYKRFHAFITKSRITSFSMPVFHGHPVDMFGLWCLVQAVGGYDKLKGRGTFDTKTRTRIQWKTVYDQPIFEEIDTSKSIGTKLNRYYEANMHPFDEFCKKHRRKLDAALDMHEFDPGKCLFVVNCPSCGHFHKHFSRDLDCEVCETGIDLIQCSCCLAWMHMRCLKKAGFIKNRKEVSGADYQFICPVCVGAKTDSSLQKAQNDQSEEDVSGKDDADPIAGAKIARRRGRSTPSDSKEELIDESGSGQPSSTATKRRKTMKGARRSRVSAGSSTIVMGSSDEEGDVDEEKIVVDDEYLSEPEDHPLWHRPLHKLTRLECTLLDVEWFLVRNDPSGITFSRKMKSTADILFDVLQHPPPSKNGWKKRKNGKHRQ
eukprot:TRINITY_DN2027_c0_g1_i1.p1 TRINITY_DN2027_c0_g1~~TRINITY_DN2027_c0_g1_i1.p1  ORF type:complete len:507 (-),score=122.10 TRINITY_DN2027_c0_g1_i1:203-1723(-)